MTVVSQSVFADLVCEPCLVCGDGTFERHDTGDETTLVCSDCGQRRATLWGVGQ